MALFAVWRDDPDPSVADRHHARLGAEAHVVPERTTRFAAFGWQVAAFATATRFHPADCQVWTDPAGGACVVHGLPWRLSDARPIDAAGLARLIDRPGAPWPDDLAGEFAVMRLHPCGTVEAFGDPAGIHQLFHRADRGDMLASRAAFLAALADDWTPEPEAALWLASIGYRVGGATGWRGVRQLPQAMRLTLAPGRPPRFDPLSDPARPPAVRGFDPALYEAGLAQAQAACRLAAGDGALDLPVTGGKDSRAVLALCLAAGLGDRLTLTTRGLPSHPDVLAAQAIAATLGLPHRREPPRGSDGPAEMTVDAFVTALATHVYQTDGGMGGWDLLVADRPGTDTLVTGHMGEVLKAFAKAPIEGPLDPVAMVRGQSPFDPLDLLRDEARGALVAALAAQMNAARAQGAAEGDLPDLFYYRNRVPNWLGGIRGVRAFERQPVMPLGVPALQRLAFCVAPEDRRAERLHHRIVRDCAPALLPLPFAHQSWPAALGEPPVPPLIGSGGALFGNWQWSINHVPAIRVWLSEFVARTDLPLWDGIDRGRLIARLRDHRFDYLEGIALLGLVAGAFHQAGLARPRRIGGDVADPSTLARPLAPAIRDRQPFNAPSPAVAGHVDIVSAEVIGGWARAPDWPGAGPMIVARDDGGELGRAPAIANRPDLAAAGISHGRYGFTIRPARAARGMVTIGGLDAPAPLAECPAP